MLIGELNGKKIAYGKNTEFLVQVGRGLKGSYKTKYTIIGNLAKAVFYYNCINIGNGFKKRLLMPSSTRKPILTKHRDQLSFSFMPAKIRQVKEAVLAKSLAV